MAKLNFKDPAESELVNNAFLGRTEDDQTTGKLDLVNPDAVSGDSITNLQRQVNENKTKLLADQDLVSSGELLFDNLSKQQIKRVQGDGAAVTLSTTPFGASPDIQDGTIFYIIGKDSTNTVTLTYQDITDGCLLNGDATLELGYSLQLFYSLTMNRFIELGRNF
jgi:hypothetical protein